MKYIRFISVIFILFSSKLMAQPAGYGFGKQIETSSVLISGTADLIDFPLFLNITDPDLRSVANGGQIENNNGFDITFTLPDCITPLFFQIEEYDPVNGSLMVWVRVPVLSPSVNTRIFMYYGNPSVAANPSSTSTWNANFDGVWHMDTDPSTSTLTDYSGNGVDGTSFGAMTSTDLINAQLGSGIDFDGANDYFALATKTFTNAGQITELTASAWINTTYVGGTFNNWSIIDFDRSEYFNVFVHGDGRLGFATRGQGAGGLVDSYAGTAGDLNDGNWHHVAAVYDGTDKLLYIDGALALTVPNAHGGAALGTGTDRFGFIGDGSEATGFNGNRNNIYYDGSYDEIRLLNSAMTTDWISTEYNNQSNPAAFYTVSEEYSASNLCLVLPIELGEFNAQINKDRTVSITWNTLSESNNDYFEILRGQNTIDWEVIDEVDGAGNSTEEIHYTSIDYSPKAGLQYYRLRQVDFNGDSQLSPIRAINSPVSSGISIYPNPANDFIFIEGLQKNLSSSVSICNELGQNMSQKVAFIQVSEHKMQLDLSNLSKGMYLVTAGSSVMKIDKR